ncbi:MAG: hypothetical protein Q8T09_13485 [Candidatus Melainabacteria bacterium]|nr:hypothetical protein [Candidatus Melainabacteria bacterium]
MRAWYIFPIVGLGFQNLSAEINEIAPDVAFLSREGLLRIVSELPEHYENFYTKNKYPVLTDFEFYIAVRCATSAPTADEYETAERNAAIAISQFMFAIFADTGYDTCGLAHRIQQPDFGCLAFREDNSMGGLFSRRQAVMFPSQPAANPDTCDSLIDLVQNSKLVSPIAQIVFRWPEAAIVNRKISERIESASLSLSNAMYADLPEEAVARTVTAFEVLLKVNNERDELIQKRLEVLIPGYKENVVSIYRARNNWVHEGKSVSKEFARLTIKFGLLALSCFCDLVLRAPSNTNTAVLFTTIDMQSTVRNHPSPLELKECLSLLDIFNDSSIVLEKVAEL